MVVSCQRRALLLVLTIFMAGCQSPAALPLDTGARATAQAFFEALIQQDWPRAYEALHPDSRASLDLDQFTRLAKSYRGRLGFEPAEVRIQLCEEQGSEALAHLVLTGRTPALLSRQYKEAIAVRASASGWRVVLPANFGQHRRL